MIYSSNFKFGTMRPCFPTSSRTFYYLSVHFLGWIMALDTRRLLLSFYYVWRLCDFFNLPWKKNVNLSWLCLHVIFAYAGSYKMSTSWNLPAVTEFGVWMIILSFHTYSGVVNSKVEGPHALCYWNFSLTITFADQSDVTPSAILNKSLPATNLYFLAIRRINTVKRGPFFEHSSQLYSIATGVPNWGKVNSGLFKMYKVREIPHSFLILTSPRPRCLANALSYNISL